MVGVAVEEVEGEVVVRCVFRHTLSERCYVQLVSSEMEEGFHQGGCVEGEGEGVHRFSGLLPASYTVLVYGLAAAEREEDSCSPTARSPDYISVATVSGPHSSSPTSQPSLTDTMTSSYTFFIYVKPILQNSIPDIPALQKNSDLLCAEGKW